MDAEQLTIKKTTFDGMPCDDDWLVIWRGLVVGRILKQPGVTLGVPNCISGIRLRPTCAYYGAERCAKRCFV